MADHYHGTGQAGPALARKLVAASWKVAVIERKFFGGACVNYRLHPDQDAGRERLCGVPGLRPFSFGSIHKSKIRQQNNCYSPSMKKILAAAGSALILLIPT